MFFKLWLETLDAERQALLGEYIRLVTFDGQRQLHPGYIDVLNKRFAAMTPEQIRQHIEETRPSAEREKQQWVRDKQREAEIAAEKEKFPDLETSQETYVRSDSTHGRIVCSDEDPQFDKKGMPMYPLNAPDPELKGYFAVHTGSERWLPILMRDQYCDGRYAYVYTIDTSLAYETEQPFYEMEDFHIMDKTDTPGSDIIFSTRQIIPPEMVKLRKVIDTNNVKPARDPY